MMNFRLRQKKGAVVEFRFLSPAEVEDIIAELWVCLEQYDAPAPEMSFSFDGPFRVSGALQLDDPAIIRMLAIRLADCAAGKKLGVGAGPGPKRRDSAKRRAVRGRHAA
jgi:hypothetical protein